MRAVAKFTRNYSTGFNTIAGKEYDVPLYFFKKYPSHFMIKMVDDKPVVKMVEEPAKVEVVKEPVKKKRTKKSK